VQQFAVTVLVTTDGLLTISAKDRVTGASRSLVAQGPAPSPLDDDGIEQQLARAGLASERPWRELDAARNQLDLLIFGLRTVLADAAVTIPDDLRARCERAIASAERQRASNIAKVRAAAVALRTASHDVADTLYRRARPGDRAAQ
jgi:molecular chaperone DnaK